MTLHTWYIHLKNRPSAAHSLEMIRTCFYHKHSKKSFTIEILSFLWPFLQVLQALPKLNTIRKEVKHASGNNMHWYSTIVPSNNIIRTSEVDIISTFLNCTIYTYGHKYQQIPRNSFVSSVTIEVKIQETTQKKHEYTTAFAHMGNKMNHHHILRVGKRIIMLLLWIQPSTHQYNLYWKCS